MTAATCHVAARVALFLLATTSAAALELHVDNPVGDVSIRTVYTDRLEVRQYSPTRTVLPEDVTMEHRGDIVLVSCRPADNARIHLEIDAPFGVPIEVITFDGAIEFDGYPSLVTGKTVEGELRLTAPWDATKLLLFGAEKPKDVELPDGFKFSEERGSELQGVDWILQDKLPEMQVTHGRIRIRTERSPRVVVQHRPVPHEAPIKMPRQAEAVVDQLLSGQGRPPATREKATAGVPVEAPAPASFESGKGGALFSSDVRMVNLAVAVNDAEGRPITDLAPEELVVYENGEPQQVAAATAEEAPFNLALLLDLSSSTQRNRDQMKEVARRFVRLARPQDRVAAYALANNWFIVIAPLSQDHERVLRLVENLPELSGGSPVYDAIALSYDYELALRPGERNALIVISDGVDNRLYGKALPSEVPAGRLAKAAERMEALIYPIYLGRPYEKLRRGSYPWEAYLRLEDLARTTGGRIFAAPTVAALEPVYQQVGQELRSVYGVAYYPKNQNFEGSWREVRVEVKRKGAEARSRSGYYAR